LPVNIVVFIEALIEAPIDVIVDATNNVTIENKSSRYRTEALRTEPLSNGV